MVNICTNHFKISNAVFNWSDKAGCFKTCVGLEKGKLSKWINQKQGEGEKGRNQ
jgi:hypothetical protein